MQGFAVTEHMRHVNNSNGSNPEELRQHVLRDQLLFARQCSAAARP